MLGFPVEPPNWPINTFQFSFLPLVVALALLVKTDIVPLHCGSLVILRSRVVTSYIGASCSKSEGSLQQPRQASSFFSSQIVQVKRLGLAARVSLSSKH